MSGQLTYNVTMPGLKENVNVLRSFVTVIENVELSYKTNRKEQAQLISGFKQSNDVLSKAIGETKFFKTALDNVTRSLEVAKAELNGYNKALDDVAKKAKSVKKAPETERPTIDNTEALSKYKALLQKITTLRDKFTKGTPNVAGLNAYIKSLGDEAAALRKNVNALKVNKRELLLRKDALEAAKVKSTDFKAELKQIQLALRKNQRELTDNKEAYTQYNQAITKGKSALSKLIATEKRLHSAKLKTNKQQKQNTFSLGKYINKVKVATKAHRSWWDSFGRVAIGFGVAYRAINLVEFAISELTASFRAGLSAMDEYIKSTATVSGMLALLHTGGSYKERFEDFSSVMGATMRETMRIMPKYRLSIEEVGDAYKELAQFGVVIAPKDVNNTLISLSAIKEIAVTTGSSSKQIRQELQAVFNGSKRITDQYGRFLARFPELEKKIYGVNKLTTSNAEKWKLATDAIAEYGLAIMRANDTVGTQQEIITNTLQILSMDSLKLTGIYDKWLKKLREISTLLISDTGEVGALGKKVTYWFGVGWQVIDKAAQGLVSIFKTTKENLTPFKNFISANWDLVSSMVKLAIGIKVANFALGGIYKTFKLIFRWPLIIAGGVWYLINVLDELNIIDLSALKFSIKEISGLFTTIIEKGRNFLNLLNPKRWQAELSQFNARKLFGRFDLDIEELVVLPLKEAKAKIVEAVGKKSWLASPFKAADIKELIKTLGMYKTTTKELVEQSTAVTRNLGDAATKTKNQIASVADVLLKTVTGMSTDEWGDIDLDFTLTEGAEDFLKRLKKLLAPYTMAVNDTFEEIKTKSKETWQYVSDGFSTYFTAIVSGEIKSFSDLWSLTLKTMRDSWAQAMSDMASDAINNFFREVAIQTKANEASFLGTAIKMLFGGALRGITAGNVNAEPWVDSGLTTGITPDSHMWLAEGGIIPEPVFGVGASGQTYSFAEKGPERVLSNSDSFSSSESTAITVEVINKSSQQVKGSQGATRMDLKGMVTQIILEDKGSNGPIARGMA